MPVPVIRNAAGSTPRSPSIVKGCYEARGIRSTNEGPGHRRITLDLAEAAGFFDLIHKFDNLFIDLNLDSVREVELSGGIYG
jgi:hypothetical protein